MSYDKLCLYWLQFDQGKALKIIGLIENGLMDWNTITVAQQWGGSEVYTEELATIKTWKQCMVLWESAGATT